MREGSLDIILSVQEAIGGFSEQIDLCVDLSFQKAESETKLKGGYFLGEFDPREQLGGTWEQFKEWGRANTIMY